MAGTDSSRIRSRREPPPLRRVSVVAREELSPRMLRVSFEGPELEQLVPSAPAASVRLLVPSAGRELVIPEWNGNEFLLPGGERPALRTFTPLKRGADALDLQIVRHPGGAVSTWAETVEPGASAALSGPGSGWEVDTDASRFLLLGDETAIPALSQALAATPSHAAVEAHIEVVSDSAVLELVEPVGSEVTWHVRPEGSSPGAPLVDVVNGLDALGSDARVWAAGEAASMQAIRKQLFESLGVSRRQTSIRGYWKPARGSSA